MWRLFHIFLNPVGTLALFLISGVGRWLDRLLGPVIGWVFSLLVLSVFGLGALSTAYALRHQIGHRLGLEPIPAVTTVTGTIDDLDVIVSGKLTIKERVTVRYVLDGDDHAFTETVSSPASDAHHWGQTVDVYLPAGAPPTIDDVNDPFIEWFSVIVGLGISALMLFWTWRYFRYRNRIYQTYRAGRAGMPVLAGSAVPSSTAPERVYGDRVLSTAERMKADELRFREAQARRQR